MKALALALIIHLAAIVSDMEYSQAQSDEYWEMERKISILALEFVRPLAVTLAELDRNIGPLTGNDPVRREMRKTVDLTLETIFSPGLLQCIDFLKGAMTDYSHCRKAWMGSPSRAQQEANLELCNLHLQGMFSDCFSKGWLEFNYKEQ